MEIKPDTNKKFLNKQIMETRDLQDDLTEFYGINYTVNQSVDNRDYAGTIPPSELARAVKDSEDIVRRNLDKEEERLEKVSDMRAYRELSKMSVNDMDWDQAHRWHELQQQYPNMSLKKGGMEDNPADMTDSSLDPDIRMHGEVLRSIEDLENLASQHGMDISHEIQAIKIDLKTFMDAIKKNPDNKVIEKGIKIALMNHDIQKHVKQNYIKKSTNTIKKKSCTKGHCTLHLDDGLKEIHCPAGSEIMIKSDGTWERK